MLTDHKQPASRPLFDEGLDEILAGHATLRTLVTAAHQEEGLRTDAAMSMAEFLTQHEAMEASLFALPFLSRMPESVRTTSEQMQRRCAEFTSGAGEHTAAARFMDALQAHLAAEETWLAQEGELRHQRNLSIA